MENREVNIEPPFPVPNFNSRFKYAWEYRNERPEVMIEHYMISWAVENLKLLPEKKVSISSPQFMLDSSKTVWLIELCISSGEEHFIDFYLHRLDEGPSAVGVTFRFGVYRPDGVSIWLNDVKAPEFWYSFYCGSTVAANEWIQLSDHRNELGNRFVVLCEMYVTYEIPRYNAELLTSADYDLINFAFDFSKMLPAVESTDYAVQFEKRRIRTHKVIIAARSPVLEDIVLRDRNETVVSFEGVSRSNIYELFRFMYSGDISFTVKDELPNMGFYECAQHFHMLELVTLLHPKQLTIKTVLKNREVVFSWCIDHFDQLTACKNITSPEFSTAAEDSTKWKFTLSYTKDSDQIAIFAKTTNRMECICSVMKISLVNRDNQPINTQTTLEFGHHKEIFGIPFLINNFSAHNNRHGLIVNGSLRVRCEIQFLVPSKMHEFHEAHSTFTSNFLDSYENLSNDLSSLMQKPQLSDLSLRIQDDSFIPVHKSVLFARSRKIFSRFVNYKEKEEIIDVLDVDADVARLMIKHAYSGKLEPTNNTNMIIRLYKAAEIYVCRMLTLITIDNLTSRISLESIFETFQVARRLKLSNVIEECEKFVRDNRMAIIQTGNWEEWQKKDLELCEELVILFR